METFVFADFLCRALVSGLLTFFVEFAFAGWALPAQRNFTTFTVVHGNAGTRCEFLTETP